MEEPHAALTEVLKQYSPIPNAFIDDMFSLYRHDTAQTDPAVDLDAVAKWLGVEKFNLMKTLAGSYKLGLDYTVSKARNPHIPAGKHGANSYKHVLMTPDCFKRLCMRSRGRTAEDVRTYFIELEALVVRYNQQLLAGIRADEEQLRRNMRPRDPADSAGYVYVIRASEKMDGVFKIGRSKDLNRRLAEYQTGRADLLEVVYKLRTDSLQQVEACVRAWLREHRHDGCRTRCNEVYKADLDLIKSVILNCDAVGRAKVEFARRKPLTMTGGYYVVLRSAAQS